MGKIRTIESTTRQTTIARTASFDGYSVIDFQRCSAELLPAPADHGIVFEVDGVPVPVRPENVLTGGPDHTTVITTGGKRVLTVEHFLAAVSAMGVDNLLIKVSTRGLPLPDFCATAYAEALAAAGLIELDAGRRLFKIEKTFRIEIPGDDRWTELAPLDGEALTIETTTVFGPPIGRMAAEFHFGRTDFIGELAWARSFVPRPLDADGSKWERIRQRYPLLPADPKKSPLIAFDASGFLTPLRRPDEPGRHKLLDLLGDLSLAGGRLAGRVTAYKPGHSFNAVVARRIYEEAMA